MFCSKCGSLMKPMNKKWLCTNVKCGNTTELKNSKKDAIISHHTDKKMTIIDKQVDTLPISKDVECPKCGENEAYWILRQTRAADEPETKIFECVKCHHKWREY